MDQQGLWGRRACLSGAVVLARSLMGTPDEDLMPLWRAVQAAVPPVSLIAQHSIRTAGQPVRPDGPHQRCQVHDLREAAQPIYEPARHATKDLTQHVRGARPLKRALEACRGSAVRSPLMGTQRCLTTLRPRSGRPMWLWAQSSPGRPLEPWRPPSTTSFT